MRKTTLFTALTFLLCVVAANGFSQSNEVLDRILDQDSLSLGAGAYMLLSATGGIGQDADFQAAARALDEQPWWKPGKVAEDPVTLGEYSYMVTRFFDIKGGIMFSIFGGARYATRELDYLGMLEIDPSPYRKLSGEEAVRILSRVLDWKEATE